MFFLLSSLGWKLRRKRSSVVKEMQTHHGTLLHDMHVCVCLCVCECVCVSIQSFSHVQLCDLMD